MDGSCSQDQDMSTSWGQEQWLNYRSCKDYQNIMEAARKKKHVMWNGKQVMR